MDGFSTLAQQKETLVFTVKELTQRIKWLLEENFLLVWVEGEIFQLKFHDSGHIFFTLKDEDALLRAVIFRDAAQTVKIPLKEGLRVLCFGRISVYPQRGEYRLVVQRVEPKGIGALQLAFEALKEELRRLGYFDPRNKKGLPAFPKRIALVTSTSGAAMRDFLKVAEERWAAEVLVYPVRVQGEGAAEEIARAIYFLNENFEDLDLIVIARGGGSLEDLWAFNERVLAEAVFSSKIPVVSAVGHETDYTICDFVADARAPTPSAAAQMVLPDKKKLLERLKNWEDRIKLSVLKRLNRLERELYHLRRRLKHPLKTIREAEAELLKAGERLRAAVKRIFKEREERLKNLENYLKALSPFGILSKGYTLTFLLPEGKLIKSKKEVPKGATLEVKFYDGSIRVYVVDTSDSD